MKSIRKITFLIIAATILFTFSSCNVGSTSFNEPWEIDSAYVYCVEYDALGGTINTLPTRTVYYKNGDLMKEPGGSEGMLTEPLKKGKVVLAWYTSYENTGTEEEPVYKFNEEDKWDFETDRINDETTDDNKKMTLYACWIDPPTVYFVDADDTESVLLKWADVTIEKPMERPTTSEKVTIKKTIDNNEVTYTLLDYYTDKECTQKVTWGAGTRTVEEIIAAQNEESAIYIYCKYIEGVYTRINSINDMKAMTDPAGKYILAKNINFENEAWKPIESDKPFSGIFLGNGYTISNINITATNRVGGIAVDSAKEKSYGLFTVLSGAIFDNVHFKDATITVGSGSNIALCTGIFGGRASDTTFKDCSIDGYKVVSAGEVKVVVSLGSAAFIDDTCIIENCDFSEQDTSGLQISTENLIIGGQTLVIE